MTTQIQGPMSWKGSRDVYGHRTYKLGFRVSSDDPKDGPATVLQTPGFPLPGATWALDNDLDAFAWCQWDAEVDPAPGYSDGEPVNNWVVTQTFSTVSPDAKSCRTTQVESPLVEPIKLSGTFIKYTEEAQFDRHGNIICNSAWEMIRGPQNEWDMNRPQVRIVMNVANLQLALLASMVDTVNSTALWGLPPRCIKLSKAAWEKRYYNLCLPYYTWDLEFDIRFPQTIHWLLPTGPGTGGGFLPGTGTSGAFTIGGFDRAFMDEGTKCLKGHFDPVTGHYILDPVGTDGRMPDPLNPQHFIRYKDVDGNICRTPLNGAGLPAGVITGTGTGTGLAGDPPSPLICEKYPESNFMLLGIPLTF